MQQLKNLIKTIEKLRGPNGCPWDQEQTFQSLTPCIIEEAYELVEALENDNTSHIIEECGDILLQVIMLSTIAQERKKFNLEDIAKKANQKMIDRHPHVFKDKQSNSVNDVLKNWEDIKASERKNKSIMDDIPKLPSLLKAIKIQKKASRQGFDWPNKDGALKKIDEEISEFNESYLKKNKEDTIEEAGDILFSIINYLRKIDINPEQALEHANKKFINRYKKMEEKSNNFQRLTLEEKEKLWEFAKKEV